MNSIPDKALLALGMFMRELYPGFLFIYFILFFFFFYFPEHFLGEKLLVWGFKFEVKICLFKNQIWQ